jgi:hypothetical protein
MLTQNRNFICLSHLCNVRAKINFLFPRFYALSEMLCLHTHIRVLLVKRSNYLCVPLNGKSENVFELFVFLLSLFSSLHTHKHTNTRKHKHKHCRKDEIPLSHIFSNWILPSTLSRFPFHVPFHSHNFMFCISLYYTSRYCRLWKLFYFNFVSRFFSFFIYLKKNFLINVSFILFKI